MNDQAMDWPETLAINAFTGERTASSAMGANSVRWLFKNTPEAVRRFLKPPVGPDPNKWYDPEVGWGVILLDRTDGGDQKSATDAPEPIRALIEARSRVAHYPVPVLRYQPNSGNRFRLLRNYHDRTDLALGDSPRGVSRGCLPHYLLIYGSPAEIPWELQYVLNASCAVGRLALEGRALENYVSALLSEWSGSAAAPERAVIWSTDHGAPDITRLMRNCIAAKVYEKMKQDPEIGAGALFIDGSNMNASGSVLARALSERSPGLIVTTSHGMTGPLDDTDRMRARLGLPVDQNFAPLEPKTLLAEWQPDGAIWYAHACCSAGSDDRTMFDDLVTPGSEIDRVLKGVAALGAQVAPLPQILLGASKPLRAFVGHVEPTFDWTLRNPGTGQFTTDSTTQALYNELFRPQTLGHAFRGCYGRLGSLHASYHASLRAFNAGGCTKPAMLNALLCARDVSSTVILGDPTVSLPGLAVKG
jgi:hypothetical protein